MKPKEIIYQAILNALEELGLVVDFVVEHPAQEDYGDYATNAAMVGYKKTGDYQSPRQLAEAIKKALEAQEELMELVDLIELAGPGFINFRLRNEWLVRQMEEVIRDGDFGKGDFGKGKKVLVEYSSPNIAKRFGVGQLRSTIYGQAVRNLYEASGWKTVGDNHLGDWGTQFGMMVAAIEEKDLRVADLSVEAMEDLYVSYNKKAKEEEGFLDKAREAFARLENGDEKTRQIWKEMVEKSMEEFDRIYKLLDVSIGNAYGESAYEQMLPEVIREMKDKGISKLSQGAYIVEFPNMPPAMLVKSNGTTTYFTRDMATIKFRNENPELKADLYVYEVGAEQQLHFQQVFAAAEMMGWGKKEDFIHIWHGLILGSDGKKMSTRKGTTIKVEEWLKEMVTKAEAINKDSAKKVGIGAVKYFDLKHDPKTSYRFDWEEALRLEGDSGPYLQYAVVRAKAVVEKLAARKISDVSIGEIAWQSEETAVLRALYRFPEVIEDAAKQFAPNLLTTYLFELAKRFNSFYNKHQIVGSEEEVSRLMLTMATAKVLEKGLDVLGIGVPSKM